MRAGADRFDVGADVLDLVFPDGTPSPLGVALGTPLAELPTPPAWTPSGGGSQTSLDLADPPGNGRRLTVRVGQALARANAIEVSFFSRDKMDVDAAWAKVRDHLDALHGKPAKEVTGLLTFVWTLQGTTFPTLARVSRFKNDQGESVLGMVFKLPDGPPLWTGGKKPSA